jgi:hypothetical protein
MSNTSTQKQLSEYKAKLLAEKKKDPKAFNAKYGKMPPAKANKKR